MTEPATPDVPPHHAPATAKGVLPECPHCGAPGEARKTIGVHEAATLTGYTPRTIRRLVASGRLLAYRDSSSPLSWRRIDADDAFRLARERGQVS